MIKQPARDRFADRRRARVLTSLRPAIVLAVGAAVVAGATWAVGWSPLLDIRTVEIVGTHRVTEEDIRAVAAVPVGSPLARLDTEGVRQRVGAVRQVTDVSVVRRWPHTVRIVVAERQPAVAVPDGVWFVLVDGEGVAFDTVSETPAGVPLVVGATAGSLGPARVTAVVEVLAALPAEIRRRATEVSVGTVDSVTVTLDEGVRVVWGSGEDGARKAAVLTALMRTQASVYDVTSPDAPTTRD